MAIPPPLPLRPATGNLPALGGGAIEDIELGRYLDNLRQTQGTHKLRYSGERHLLLFGANGSGKGTRILMPNLLTMGGNRSIIVVDPKGELAAVTANYRRSIGNRVVILNPYGVLTEYQGYTDLEGCGFNPLCGLDPTSEDFNEEASLLADAMITPNPNAKDPHWTDSARALIAAVIMYVAIVAREKRAIPTMAHVRQLICMASEAPRPPSALFPQGSEGYGIPKLAMQMMRSSIAGLRNKAAQFTDWNEEIQSIASTAKVQTEMFDAPQIARNLAANDFDFRDLKRYPTTVYLVLPPQVLRRQGKWLRLVLTSALQACTRTRYAGEPRILFMLDEFAALGHLQIIEDYWAQVRGYGIQMMPVLQDLSQLKSIYRDRWESFVANAGVVMSFAANDQTTAEWLSKRTGQTTRIKTTVQESSSYNEGESHTYGGISGSRGDNSGYSWSRNASSSAEKVPMMLPQEFYNLREGQMILSVEGMSYPIFAHAPGYWKVRTTHERSRLNPYVHNVPRDPFKQSRAAGEPTWDWGEERPQPSVGGWGETADNGWDVSSSGFDWGSPSPAPSLSKLFQTPSSPPQHCLPPTENRGWDDDSEGDGWDVAGST